MIRVLSEDVRCRLRSGVAITSVAQCVEELLLNSADAQATCIAVRVDLETFKVQVVDNGCGLHREDMECVGMRYFTSKCHSVKDLENVQFYGFRGEAIASMVDVSGVVEICSRHKGTGQTFSRIFRNGKPLGVVEAESLRPSSGTTVTLYNLFSNLPVRRKHLEPVLDLEWIRQRVEAVSLVKPDVSFSLRNDAVHSVLLHLPKTKDLCSRFCQIYGPSRSQSLREVQHKNCGFTIHGFLSCESHYNRTMQFLYVNSRLVLKTKLHKLIDFIIRRESSICRGRSGRPRSATDLYGVFVVNVQCPMSEYDVCFQPDKTLIEFQNWDQVMLCVEQGIRNFLKRENLFLEPCQDDVAEFSQKHHYNLSCGWEEGPGAPQDPSAALTYDVAHLRSRCVHRSRGVTETGSPPAPQGVQNGSEQIPGNVPETHIGLHDSTCMDDMEEPVESPNVSLVTPTIQETAGVFSSPSANPRSPGTERVCGGSSKLILPNKKKPRGGPGPTHIQLSMLTSLGGTLYRFRRHYGKSCRVGRDYRAPQLPRCSGKAGAISMKHYADVDASVSSQERSTEPNTSKLRNSQESGGTPTLIAKLCMLKNNMEEAAQAGEQSLSSDSPPTSTTCEDGAQSPYKQQDGQTCENPPDTPKSQEWLQCYEKSVGKSIFINPATGLSSYSAPIRDQAASCTQDLSNMAVNVICRSGFQYQCHPFKTPALLPFLPRTCEETRPAGQRGINAPTAPHLSM